MAIDYKILGERIKNQRKTKDMTQEHFAEHMNVSVGYISQIERGITKSSSEKKMLILLLKEFIQNKDNFK